MAMHFNSPNSNSIGLNVCQDTIDNHFYSLNQNFGLNHVNESSLLASHLLSTVNPAIDFHHKNDFLPRRSHSPVGLSQLGLSQRVTEVRRTYVTPGRVQVHSVIDYFPVQNQPSALPLSDFSVAEVVRTTQFLNANSTKDRIFAPTDSVRVQVQGQTSVQNRSVPSSSNPVNHPFITPEPSFDDPFYQTPPGNKQTLNLMNLGDHFEANRDGILDPQPVSVFISETRDQNASPYQLGINLQNLNLNGSKTVPVRPPSPMRMRTPVRVPSPVRVASPYDLSDSDDEIEYEGDGRTHSLPCPRHGPYTCPRCNGVFFTSQMFAAHMGSHYKTETRAERKKRQAAKYKNKNLRLVHSRNGLTVLPRPFKVKGKPAGHRRNAAEKAKLMAVTIELESEEKVQEQGQAVAGAVKEEDRDDIPFELFEVKIKQEPM